MSSRSQRLALGFLLLGSTLPAQTGARQPRLGTVSFPNSGSAAAQPAFLEGLLYLHSFEYESAERAFRRAEREDSTFAMAYWGEAMTYNHGVWNEQDASSARSALERLGPSAEARRARAPTAREQRYLEAVEALYGAGPKARRDTLYSGVMERLVRENPEDLEAKAFYALALLSLNQGVRDTATYLRAAPYADTVLRANPDHPGAAHYLIHAYDDPLHASLGLAAARAYSRIAPDAAHAQHMTTHIFLALGMWDEVVSQNSIAVEHTAHLPGHYTAWLVYGLIEQGRYDQARAMLNLLRQNLAGGGLREQYAALAITRAHYLLHSEEWGGPIARWQLPSERMTVIGETVDEFTSGVIAFRRRDRARLSAAASNVARLVGAVVTDLPAGDPTIYVARAMARELGGMQLYLGGDRAAAIRALREAAALEDEMPMEFGPPLLVEPAHEVLGTLLLEVDPRDALRQFQRALVLAPGRSRALQGAIRAAAAIGDREAAHRALDRLSANWHAADPKTHDELLPLIRLVDRMS